MPQLLDDRDSHALVRFDNGHVELIPWSDHNRLVYRHDLHGLLVEGTDILTLSGEGYSVRITPEDRNTYLLDVGDGDHADMVVVPEHRKKDLLDRLLEVYETDDHSPIPLVDLASDLLDYDVLPRHVDPLATLDHFDAVEVRPEGWLIHDHVLLTYDNEFYHPSVERKDRNGKVVDDAANKHAYELRFDKRPDIDRGQSELGNFAGLGDDDATVEFVARALWAVTYTPEEL